MKMKFLTEILGASILILSSCTSSILNEPIQNVAKPAKYIAGVKENKGASVNLKINTNAFNTKASSNGQLPKNETDVMSFDAFLTTDPVNPFTIGANPAGNGVIFSSNKSATGIQIITFSNVPPGGPYYAVVAGFDKSITDPTRKNITEINPDLLSPDQRWAVSSNNVSVNSNFTLIFSDTYLVLNILLQLQSAAAPMVDVVITPTDGVPDTSPYGAISSF